MKKLIISIVATASIALVAKADVAPLNATSFENLAVGPITEANQLRDEDGNIYWTGYSADSELAVKELGVVGGLSAKPEGLARPLTGDDAKALAIDVDTRLSRNIQTSNGEGVAQDIGTGLYFDSMVQFTATTETPTVTEGDKLIVWLKENEIEGDDSTYTLCVTAGVLDNDFIPTAKVFETGVSIAPDSWHRLSIAAIVEPGEEKLRPNLTKFKVYVDSVLVETDTPLYSLVNYQNEADENSNYYNRITSVSFQGKGAIDDLVWTTEDPFYVAPVIEKVNVSVAINDFDAITAYFDGTGEITSGTTAWECDKNSSHTISFMLKEGYQLVSSSPEAVFDTGVYIITVQPDSDTTVTIVTAPVEEPVAKPFTVNGTAYETLAGAIAAANGAEIKLTEDATLTATLTVAEAAVIDLNGQTLTLADGGDYYSVVVKAALTITDSSQNKDGKVIVPGLYGFGVGSWANDIDVAGTLTIDAGTIESDVADYLIGAFIGTVNISGGVLNSCYCVVNAFGKKDDGTRVAINISGGTFSVAETDVTGEYESGIFMTAEGATWAVSGGLFSMPLDEEYCAEGYIPTTKAVEGYYTVVRGYAVTIEAANADVSALAAKYAAGATVAFTVTPATDYNVTSVTMNGETLTADNGTYSFTMPVAAVTIVVTTYKEPSVEPDGDETITEPISDTAKDVIKDQFPAGGVVIKVEVNGDTLKGDAAVKMINKVVDMFKGTPFVVDDQGVAKLELVFKVDDVMAIVNGLTGGYTLKAGNATFNTDAYEVVPRWYDIDSKTWDVPAPKDGATKGFFKLKVQKKNN